MGNEVINIDNEDIVSVKVDMQDGPNYLELKVKTNGPFAYSVFAKTGYVVKSGEMMLRRDDGEDGVTTRMDLAVIFARAHIDMVRYRVGSDVKLPGIDEVFEWTTKFRIGKWMDGDCPFLYPNEGQLTTWTWGDKVVRLNDRVKAFADAEARYENAMKDL